MDNKVENWGIIIKRLRLQYNLTQDELGVKSKLGRGSISQIERGRNKDPKEYQINGLAKGFGMSPDMLRQHIYGKPLSRRETFDEALQRVIINAPKGIPVYPDYYSLHAGTGVEPVDYIWIDKVIAAPGNLQAFVVHGDCLQPIIEDGDIAIIDRDAAIDSGDLVACLIDGELHIAKFKRVDGEPWLENRHGSKRMEECQESAAVIEIIKKVKKNYHWTSG